MGRRVPKYCRHRSSGRGYVTDPGSRREVYFPGVYDSAESVGAYERWVRDYLARGPGATLRNAAGAGAPAASEVWRAFLAHAEGYYQKHGRQTSALGNFRQAAWWCLEILPGILAEDLSPLRLRQVRDAMVTSGLARATVNKYLGCVRHAWRWAAAEELVPAAVLEGLRSVPDVRRGRGARERPAVGPVDPAALEAVLPLLEARVRGLVCVQLGSGCRPGEALCLRPCDVDRGSTPWLYVPWTWKTEHTGGPPRRIWLGPRAREALAPLLAACPATDAWCFPSRHDPARPMTGSSYWRALGRACRRAGVILIRPGQLRHSRATEVRRQDGLEAAQAVLGHEDLATTQVYAERLDHLAREIAERTG